MKNPMTKYLLAVACASVSVSAFAEDVWVNRPSLDIREGKGAAYGIVATAVKGDKLAIIAREDKWVKVSLNGKEGYVFENSISPKEVPHEKMSNMDAEAKAMATDAAAKGLRPEALKYAQDHNYSEDGLNKIKAMRKLVSGKELEAFAADGKLTTANH